MEVFHWVLVEVSFHWERWGHDFNLIMMLKSSITREHNYEGCSESSSQSRWRTISQKWRWGVVKHRCAWICAIKMLSIGKNGAREWLQALHGTITNINEIWKNGFAMKNFEKKTIKWLKSIIYALNCITSRFCHRWISAIINSCCQKTQVDQINFWSKWYIAKTY